MIKWPSKQRLATKFNSTDGGCDRPLKKDSTADNSNFSGGPFNTIPKISSADDSRWG